MASYEWAGSASEFLGLMTLRAAVSFGTLDGDTSPIVVRTFDDEGRPVETVVPWTEVEVEL